MSKPNRGNYSTYNRFWHAVRRQNARRALQAAPQQIEGAMNISLGGIGLVTEGNLTNPTTVLLCGFEGSDGSTIFDDESYYNHTLTGVGNVQIDTGVAPPFGTSSALFDGVGDWINLNDHAAFTFGYNALTFDAFVRLSSMGTTQLCIVSQYRGTGSQRAWSLHIGADGVLRFFMGTGGTNGDNAATTSGIVVASAALSWTLGQWYHIRVDRTAADPTTGGSVVRLYRDGAMVRKSATAGAGSGTNISILDSTTVPRIGANNNNSGEWPFFGHIKELRIINGEALCADDAGFVVPTAPFPR